MGGNGNEAFDGTPLGSKSFLGSNADSKWGVGRMVRIKKV
jgi:hypothetical protein